MTTNRIRLLLLNSFLLLSAERARAAGPPGESYYYGIGRLSCATWTPATEGSEQNWLFGFWSALNETNPINKAVGSRTDGSGIVEEVRKVCRDDPSLDVGHATVRAYEKLMSLRR